MSYLTPAQAAVVKSTIPLLRAHGERITTIFYRDMLIAHPELSPIFNSANQATGRQPRALTSLILAFAEHINSISDLSPVMERVCQKHVSLDIKPQDYDIVGTYLLRAFAAVLGRSVFTKDVETAWAAAYGVLARMLSGREAQLYRSFGPWKGFRDFKISRKVQETRNSDIFSLYLVPADGQLPLPTFLPGQYVSLQIPISATATRAASVQTRQYSLSEKPRPDYYRITLKREVDPRTGPGLVSSEICDHLNPGDIVKLSHPAGEFFLDVGNDNVGSTVPLVLISAGIGVSPMLSILNATLSHIPHVPSSRAASTKSYPESPSNPLITGTSGPAATHAYHLSAPTSSNGPRTLSRPESPTSQHSAASSGSTSVTSAGDSPVGRSITWIHGSRGDSAFEIYIRSVSHLRNNFQPIIFKTNPLPGDVAGTDYDYKGRVDMGVLSDSELHMDHGGTEYYICGPEAFMLDMRDVLVKRGVDQSRIKCELFNTGDLLEMRRQI